MIRRKPDGKYNPYWRDAVAMGRAKKRAARPKRDILAIKQALKTLRLRYRQEVCFWNDEYKGPQENWDGGYQWVDFEVQKPGGRAFVVIYDDPTKRWKAQEKEAYKIKQQGLDNRKMQYLILKRGMSSQEYQLKISWFMRKVK